MKKYFRFWAASLVLLALGILFAGCASAMLPLADDDPFKGTTWGLERPDGMLAFVKFKDDGTALRGNHDAKYTVYKTDNGYQVEFSINGLKWVFKYDSSKPDAAACSYRIGASPIDKETFNLTKMN